MKELDDKKRKLNKKLDILKGQENYSGNVDAIVKQKENELQQKIENLKRDQEKLKDDFEDTQKAVDEAKQKSEAHRWHPSCYCLF